MSGIGTLTTPTVAQAAAELLPVNAIRKKVIIQNNDGANNVVIKPDANPGSDTDGIILAPGEKETFEIRNAIHAKSNNAGGTLVSVLDIVD